MAQAGPHSDAPFIIGVSGHRDLGSCEAARLGAALAEFLQQIRLHLPDTEIRVMAGMADGADLLAARAALDSDLSVDAVLPLPLPQYAADFDVSSFRELESLLAHPKVRQRELPSAAAADPGNGDEGDRRNAQYLSLTRTLIGSCHLLIALWDGEYSVLPGGTADTVLRYLGLRSDRRPQDSPIVFTDAPAQQHPDSRLVYWIPTPRGSASSAGDPAQCCYLSGLGDDVLQRWAQVPEALQQELVELNTYNREYRLLVQRRGTPAAPDSLMRSLSSHGELPLSPAERPWLERIDAEYGKADALALHFQRLSDRLFAFFTLTAFVMGLAYLAYEKFIESRLLLFFYVIVLLSGFGLYFVLKGRRWFAKHLMYRALAETLRAQFYLSVAGAEHLVDADEVISLSGIDRFHGFGWITHVLTGFGRRSGGLAASGEDERLVHIETAWIDSQCRYFAGKVERLERSSRRTRRLKRILFAAILVAITGLLLLGRSADDIQSLLGISLHRTLSFAMGLPALVLGVWELHQDKMAVRELLWQYRNQLDHFSRARVRLSQTSSAARRREILAALGKDSLMESYLWTTHRYHREHEPSTG